MEEPELMAASIKERKKLKKKKNILPKNPLCATAYIYL